MSTLLIILPIVGYVLAAAWGISTLFLFALLVIFANEERNEKRRISAVKRRQRKNKRKDRLSKEDEDLANYFSNIEHGFDNTGEILLKRAINTPESVKLLKEMDRLGDNKVFKNTEEI